MFQYELTYSAPFNAGEKHLIRLENTDFYIDNPEFQIRVSEEELPLKHNEIMKNEGVKFKNMYAINSIVEISFKGTYPDSRYLSGNYTLRHNEDGIFHIQIFHKDFTDMMNHILRNYSDLEILEIIRY